MNLNKNSLYTIRRDVICLKCGCTGAVQSYGKYYPSGLADKVDEFGDIVKKIMEKHRDLPYMSMSGGFGGTIPHECLNCGNVGLIDMGGLECYEQAFKSIKTNQEE